MKKIACFDIDGTIFRSGLYREVVDELLVTGKIPQEVRKNYEQLEVDWKMRNAETSFKAFEQAMAENFDAVLPQIECAVFDAAAERVVERLKDYVYVYTRNQAATLKKQGYTLIAISGSQEELARPFAEYYRFDIVVAQQYTRGTNGYFTGEIIKTHHGKDLILQQILDANPDLTLEDSVGFGDTAGDIGMLKMVTHPTAFNPDKRLFEEAKNNNWRVVIERKNMIYELKPENNSFILS